ncbi:MAG: hypothetical protein AB1650_06380 [Candidatus Omnitrophota bacterium]
MKSSMRAMIITAVVMLGGTGGQGQAATIADYFSEKGIPIEVSAGTDYYSKYVWRGMLLDDDSVLQPGVKVSVGNVTAGFWGSWDLESEDSRSSDEVDGYIDYSFDLGFLSPDYEKLGMSVGHTWYTFPETDFNAQEYYLGFSLDMFLSPSLTWYHDYSDEATGGADGDYLIAAVKHSIPLSEKYGISLDIGQEAGYNDAYFIRGEGGYSLTKAGVSVPLSDNATISVNAGYSIPLGDLEADDDGNYDDEFYYGAGMAFAF